METLLHDSSLFRSACFVAGEWIQADSGKTFEVTNKATGQALGKVPLCGKSETETAICAAVAAAEEWAHKTGKERSAILRKWYELIVQHVDDLSIILTMEQGKPLAEAKGEVLNGASYVEWYAEEAKRVYGEVITSPWKGKQPLVIRQPIGVVAAITPWNFPSAMLARKASPALAAGCPIIIKPASATPFSALALVVLAERAGFPKGVVSVLTGSYEIGDVLCASSAVRGLSFTGSTAVGKQLMAQCAPTVKKLALELGGNAPFIVFDKCDLEATVQGAMSCKLRNAGQTCISANRFLVEDTIHDEFVEKLKMQMKTLILGSGMTQGVTLGPVISSNAIAFLEELVADAVSKGARIVCGGKAATALQGNFFEPTIITDVTPAMRLFTEEIFGPIASILRFSTEKEAIALANDTPYGLASYVFTQDLGQMWRVSSELKYGLVGANEVALASGELPFGGVKESGLGREGGKQGLEEFLDTKYILMGGF